MLTLRLAEPPRLPEGDFPFPFDCLLMVLTAPPTNYRAAKPRDEHAPVCLTVSTRSPPRDGAIIAREAAGLPFDHPARCRRLLRAISMARSMAGCAMFLILTQSRQRPER